MKAAKTDFLEQRESVDINMPIAKEKLPLNFKMSNLVLKKNAIIIVS